MPYDKLEPTDELLVNQGSTSYSIEAETLRTEMTSYNKLQSTDKMLVNRGTDSYSVEIGTIKEEIAPKGEIESPVVVLTPPNGAGLAGEEVTPAAEGITGVVEGMTAGTIWSDLVSNPGGTLYGDVTNGFDGTLAEPFVTYTGKAFPENCAQLDIPILSTDKVIAIVQSDPAPFLVDAGNGTQTFMQTSGPNTRIDISSAFTSDVTSWKIGSAGNWNFSGIEINDQLLVDNSDTTPTASLTYTTDNNLSLLTEGQSMTQKPAYTPVTDTITNVSGSAPTVELTFDSPKDLVNFRPGDVVQYGTGNPDWNETQVWSSFASGNVTKVEIAFDGNLLTDLGAPAAGLPQAPGGGYTQAVFTFPLDVTSTIEVHTRGFLGENAKLYVGGNLIGNIAKAGDDFGWVSNNYSGQINADNPLIIRNSATNRSFLFNGIRIDGKILVDPTPVQVVSTDDIANNKLTVDGGTWDVSNQSQVWSSGTFVTGGVGDISKFFDGDITSNTFSTDAFQYDFPEPVPFTDKVRLSASAQLYIITDTGTYECTNLPNSWASNPSLIDVTSLLSGSEIRSITGASSSVALAGIEVDGKLLVDAVNDSQVWSDLTTGTVNPLYPINNAFDGDLSTMAVPGPGDTTGKWSYTTNLNSSPIDCTSFEVYFTLPVNTNARAYVSLNGTEQQITDGNPGWKTVTVPNGLTLTSFALTREATANTLNDCSFGGVRINEKMLLDSGVRNLGDTEVTGPLCQGTGEYVSNDGTTLELTNAGDRWCVDDQNVGLAAVSDTEYTVLAPDPNEIVFQSANGEPLTTTFSAENCVLREITWTLGVSETGEAGTYVETEYEQLVAVPINIEVPPWAGPQMV